MVLPNYNHADDISASLSIYDLEQAQALNLNKPATVPLGLIVTALHHFQPKLSTISSPHRATLIKLKEVLKAGKIETIPPLTVFGSAKEPVVIDGHHRLLAYREALNEDHEIAVEWFEGDYNDAITATLTLNDEQKRCVYAAEKLTFIWRWMVRLLKSGALWDDEGQWLPEHSQKMMRLRFEPVSLSTIKNLGRRLTDLRDDFPFLTSQLAQQYRGDFYAFIIDDPLHLETATWRNEVDDRLRWIRADVNSSGSLRNTKGEFDFDARVGQIAVGLVRGVGKETSSNMHNGEVLAAALMRLLPEDKLEAVTDAMVAGCSEEYLQELREGLLD